MELGRSDLGGVVVQEGNDRGAETRSMEESGGVGGSEFLCFRELGSLLRDLQRGNVARGENSMRNATGGEDDSDSDSDDNDDDDDARFYDDDEEEEEEEEDEVDDTDTSDVSIIEEEGEVDGNDRVEYKSTPLEEERDEDVVMAGDVEEDEDFGDDISHCQFQNIGRATERYRASFLVRLFYYYEKHALPLWRGITTYIHENNVELRANAYSALLDDRETVASFFSNVDPFNRLGVKAPTLSPMEMMREVKVYLTFIFYCKQTGIFGDLLKDDRVTFWIHILNYIHSEEEILRVVGLLIEKKCARKFKELLGRFVNKTRGGKPKNKHTAHTEFRSAISCLVSSLGIS